MVAVDATEGSFEADPNFRDMKEHERAFADLVFFGQSPGTEVAFHAFQ